MTITSSDAETQNSKLAQLKTEVPRISDIETFWKKTQEEQFGTIEHELIAELLKTDCPWEPNIVVSEKKKVLKEIKDKIKKFHLEKQHYECCYCGTSLLDRSIETDREHIIPKGFKKSLSYNLFNLSVACKRCNMTHKGQLRKHLADEANILKDLYKSDSYKIPHPNLDVYSDHIKRIAFSDGNVKFLNYKLLTAKGEFLYDFVKLNLIEIEAFDEAQGLQPVFDYLNGLMMQ